MIFRLKRTPYCGHSLLPRVIFFSFLWSLFSCQSNPVHDFEKVKVGQDKGEVLEIMGSPDSSWRQNGIDRWSYTFYDKDNGDSKLDKEVQFEDGKAIYVGNKPVPKISAEEQDKLNAESNVADDTAAEAARKARFQPMEDYETSVKEERKSRPATNYEEIQ